MSKTNVKEIVKERYGKAVVQALGGEKSSCCGAGDTSISCCDPITDNLYDIGQISQVPEEAMLASFGCGNPTTLAELKRGEVVLDLGSGGGIDVLLSARRVGPTGKAYGLDMTDEMLAVAEQNKRKSGLTNVEFLKGEIEEIPLPDNSVDVIISNCVINLSADKDKVIGEAFRVLKPGGRFAVSDVVTRGEMPPEIRERVPLWSGCIAGALEEQEYRSKLRHAGFENVDVEPTRIYRIDHARTFLNGQEINADSLAPHLDGRFMSASVREEKRARVAPLTAAPSTTSMTLARKAAAEGFGTMLLLAAIVGSGIMGERSSGDNVAIALLANTVATGAMLVATILAFGRISGAHFNPIVTLAIASQGGLRWAEVPGYLLAQIVGALTGVALAHLMFGETLFTASQHTRTGGAQLFSEFVATFGLLSVIWGCARSRLEAVPFAVGAYITAGYWFTASTAFANPAVTLARSFTNTFSGVRPADVPGFIVMQFIGAFAATLLFRWLSPALPEVAKDVVAPHSSQKEIAGHGR